MLDFTELSANGQDFGLLIRELLLRRGFAVYWSGKGADGGRDLICVERRESYFIADEKRWLIQCKHNAVSGKSVGIGDLDNIVDSCSQHHCNGYILACSTYPSSAVIQRLEAITSAPNNPISATCWDAVKIEQMLSTPRNWPIAQRFFPKSANAEGWLIYGTERPNHWVVNYKGYYFHLTNRIGSAHQHHLSSIRERVKEIESITLPNDHFIRIRSVYYDDKNGGYRWHLDYMYPNDGWPAISTAEIAAQLGEGQALEDGQIYHFDVRQRSYNKNSDHYDPDHYEYYVQNIHDFLHGLDRERDLDALIEARGSEDALRRELAKETSRGYDRLVAAFKSVGFIRLVRSCNARLEDLTRFHLRRGWSEVIRSMNLETDHFFSAWFLFEVQDVEKFFELLTTFPQGAEKHFRLTNALVFLPSNEGRGSVKSSTDKNLFELTLSIHPSSVSDMATGRKLLNDYFLELAGAVDERTRKGRA